MMRYDSYEPLSTELYSLQSSGNVLPVSVADCKGDLRLEVDFTDEDLLIESYIIAATRLCSEMSGRKVTGETYVASYPYFYGYKIKLPLTPVQSIQSVKYFDGDNTEITADISKFNLLNFDRESIIEISDEFTLPTTYLRLDAVNITFLTGYGTERKDIPESLTRAIRLTVAHWYENRSASIIGVSANELPLGVQALLGVERTGWVG